VDESPLGLSIEEMRRLGHLTVDALVDRLADPGTPLSRATPEEMRARLGGPPPEEPQPFEEVLAGLGRDVLDFAARGDHPGFFAFIPYCGTWPGALGDFVASACNLYASSWMESPGPSQLELEVLGWFKDWIGYPASASGILVSGGSAGNLTALACAREARVGPMSDDLVIYVCDQAHSSLARAARALGFRPDQVRVLPSGPGFRLQPESLEGAIVADLEAGRRPFLCSASVGSTNTGAVDPVAALADVCAENDVWLHVDAAYGGFAGLTERGRAAIAGIDRADSVTLDPHKWLFQPYECGGLLVRDGAALRRAFEIAPDYLLDAVPDDGEVNFADLGLQLSRTSRAVKLWLSVRTFGLASFRRAIDSTLDLGEWAQARIEASDTLELVSPASLGIVAFRRDFPEAADEQEAEALHLRLVAALEDSGLGIVSSTRLRGRYALRMCPMNHTTRREHVEAVLAFLESAPVAPADGPPPRVLEREPPDGSAWLGRPGLDAPSLAELPLFHGLEDEDAAAVLADAREVVVPSGEIVVGRWEGSRELFVVLDGLLEAERDGAEGAALGAGDVFGEVAALEWGAGYGYARTATVRAVAETRLLVLPAAAVASLVRRAPEVGERLRRLARERLYA
jgi:glutamate/tyrosine decarboxylase-like PLP-dependent enzyme